MTRLPRGTIALRDDRLGRSWVVTLGAFEIGTFPVTQAQYAAVTGLSPPRDDDAACPAVNVSWLDAVEFCNLLSAQSALDPCYALDRARESATLLPRANGYRLPNEAQWEYACRAGTNGPRYGPLTDIAWFAGNAGGRARGVGQKQPNAWGLHDMLGNVWEWCEDQYDPEVYGLYRVFRGGGWSDHERGCLATNRRRSHPTFSIDDVGLRVVRVCQ